MKEESKPINITLMSFGFKYQFPNANYFFDVGFIKNPAREVKWGFFSNVDEEMRQFVLQQPEVVQFMECVVPLIKFLSGIDSNQIFAFGCSAGRHRSPLLVDALARQLRDSGLKVKVVHRDCPPID